MMISVLVADDEYLLRSLIKNSVPWKKVRMQVIAEAGDGEEAWECIQTLKPQIALIDINMPFLNGLELTKKIHESPYNTKVIILTGYKDFEFAKEAVTYHAFDYLLKPVDSEELVTVLNKARKEIVKEKKAQHYLFKSKRETKKNIWLYKEGFLSRLTFGRLKMSPGQISQEIKKMGINLYRKNICVIAMQIDKYDELGEDKNLYIFALLNMAKELLEKHEKLKNIEIFSEVDNYALILLNTERADDRVIELLKLCCREIIDTFETYFSFTVSAGIGRSQNGYENIHLSLVDALNALEGRFYDAGEKVFSTEPDSKSCEFKSGLDFFNFGDIHWDINYVKMKDALDTVKTVFDQLRERHMAEEYVKILAFSFIAILYLFASKKKTSFKELEKIDDHIFERISKSMSFNEVEQIVVELYNQCILSMQKKISTKKIPRIVLNAKKYIERNYSSPDISLNKIADAVFTNATYISSLFKKELDINISDYITLCRMKRAVELLLEDNEITVSDISQKVGYTDPYYFSKCFKKYYGITPSKFIANESI